MLAQKQESHGTGLFRTGDGVDAVVLGVAQTETLTETSGPACKVAHGPRLPRREPAPRRDLSPLDDLGSPQQHTTGDPR